MIDGRLETALSSAQILRGKLERADEPLARDVFDIVKANEKEPDALEVLLPTSQQGYTLSKPSNCPNNRDHFSLGAGNGGRWRLGCSWPAACRATML